MVAPNTGSLTEGVGGINRTGTALSTNIIIEVNGQSIGAIKSISYTEDRSITMIDEVGTDGHIDSAPNKSTNVTGSCKRVRFDGLRLPEAFARGFIHVKSQRVPFDILIKDIHNGDEAKSILTTIKNVWIKRVSTQYSADDFIIVDDMDFEAEDIYSTLGTSSTNVATGGERGITLDINSIERAADRGNRRGSLDASGLISAFFDGFPGTNP